MAKRDEFNHAQFGIFAGSEGLANIDNMEVEQTPDYFAMTRKCEGCGETKQCQVDWAELYCLQYGVNPSRVGEVIQRTDLFDTAWAYHPGVRCFHPGFRCSCNGHPLVLFDMTPIKAERLLHEASRNGIISDTQVDIIRTIAPVVKQLANASRGVPAQQVQRRYAQGAPPPAPGVPMGPPQPMAGYPNGVPVQYPVGYDPRRR